MKKYIVQILLFSFLINIKIIAQEVIQENNQSNKVLSYYDLNIHQQKSLDSITKIWNKHYEKFIKKEKIKMGCGGISNNECEGIYMDAILKINKEGKLEYYKLVTGKKCGIAIDKPTEIKLMKPFFQIKFPEELKETKFQTRLGSVLKC